MDFFNKMLTLILLLLPLLFMGQTKTDAYSLFGNDFSLKETLDTPKAALSIVGNDSIPLQLTGKITEVCQMKGCWMNVDLDGESQVFVRFKDYGFFVPTDSANKTAILNGMAFVEVQSIEDQRHYAADRGATESELQKIDRPKRILRFEADGVMIQE